MDDQPLPSPDRLAALVAEEADGDAVACLERFEAAGPDDRKAAMRALRSVAADRPVALEPLCPSLARFLTDDTRAVRLSAAKLFVAVAESDPDAVVPVVPSLADRLADEDEFYYVRARSAEALGYVALEYPEEVASPETLADLRVGLSFDEPEVTEKLAKAIEYVALGDPGRLDHLVERLADHTDDGNELVRYHLCTALAAVGCESPEKLAPATAQLEARLDDESAYVRGRASEALGLVARPDGTDVSLPRSTLEGLTADEEPFVADRARFAVGGLDHDVPAVVESGQDASADRPAGVGTVEGVRATTGEAVDDIASPDDDGECPHCGLELPANGPPMCPRCGGPH